jgi:hypothetical protein
MSDLVLGPVIVTKYCHQTSSRNSRIMATHKRDSETTWRCYWSYDHSISPEDNHLAAAAKLLASWPYENALRIVGRGHDENNFYFLCSSA